MKTEKQLERIKKQISDYIISFHTRIPYIINLDGSVDILQYTEFRLPHHIKKLPFRINSIKGGLTISSNQLTTLEGLPETVNGNLNIYNDNLASLEYCPQKVFGRFECYFTSLTSTLGSPKYIKGSAYLYRGENIIFDGIDYIGGTLFIGSGSVSEIRKMPKVRGKIESYNKQTEIQMNKLNTRTKNINSILN